MGETELFTVKTRLGGKFKTLNIAVEHKNQYFTDLHVDGKVIHFTQLRKWAKCNNIELIDC
jgi:hypothetical protein